MSSHYFLNLLLTLIDVFTFSFFFFISTKILLGTPRVIVIIIIIILYKTIIIIFAREKITILCTRSNSRRPTIPDLTRYNLNKFSLKRFVEFADVGQLIVEKNMHILHPIIYTSKPSWSSIIYI